MFELADTLVGIFKVHNCTDSITVTPDVYSDVSALVVTNLILESKFLFQYYVKNNPALHSTSPASSL